MAGPFLGNQVVMDRPLSRIENEIVDNDPANAAFEQRAALVVVREEIADDGDLGGVVVDEGALGMLDLPVCRTREGLGNDVVGNGDPMRGVRSPFIWRVAREAAPG